MFFRGKFYNVYCNTNVRIYCTFKNFFQIEKKIGTKLDILDVREKNCRIHHGAKYRTVSHVEHFFCAPLWTYVSTCILHIYIRASENASAVL